MSGNNHDNDADDLTRPATQVEGWDELPEASAEQWQPGQRLGPFLLKKQLGSGGMGLVWLAEQVAPLRREVALKVMRPERRSRLAEAHFEVERQALAQLSHDAIARIYDAGELPDGNLFFAMEYVPGKPLHEHIAAHPPSLRELVALMVEVCGGLQHAHQHGLIHRDIKPANILVGQRYQRPQPKIIDFGIAIESVGENLGSGRGLYRAGTAAYMAPEQRDRDGGRIDVRTDVYALGAVLAHCLLVHAGAELSEGQRFDGTTAYSALGRKSGAGNHASTEALPEWTARLAALPAELRAVARRAMAPEREHRYQSATAMAEDLQRWLDAEPLQAMGDSRSYRLRCFLRRNALVSAAGGLIALALMGGTVAALYGLTEAREGRSQAESALELAEKRRMEAEELIQFMLGDFAEHLRPIGRLDLLDSIGAEALRYLTARDAGDDWESALSRARALRTLGEVQVRRQQFDEATDILARSADLLEPWHEKQASELAELHFEAGQIAFWRGLATYRERDWETTEVHWLQYKQHAQRFAELGDDKLLGRQELSYAYNNLGTLAEARNQLTEAHDYFQQTIEMRRELVDENDVESVINLANALSWSARIKSALGLSSDAWRSNGEALDLLEAARDIAPEHARRRSLEINFRSILARDGDTLGFHEYARNQLRTALQQAEVDVANEPEQPRRQANLARIAFLLATLTTPDHQERTELVTRGERALEAAMELGLDTQRTVEIPAEGLRARLHDPRYMPSEADLAIARRVFEALEEREEFDAHFFNLVTVATALVEALMDRSIDLPNRWMDTLQAQLDAVPQTQHDNLRYKTTRYRLGRILNPQASELESLKERIDKVRQAVKMHIQADEA
ncbi:serine/threonine protein kinase [Wenzhouxiangella sp. AB-CW3]|uniref:serine/threonine protein kinase n=1 Tax=Wenzhouxiangella sp. AB-CW3 TaxID=2771012 RepID=UPI00168AE77C|nr:serine/threonine-protein kinase [Wenzhouxiangella sp. AB-CW3]QOC23273.1 serine/threonine protein kinase [Wenzhouxiangella sp. AB-CW3]